MVGALLSFNCANKDGQAFGGNSGTFQTKMIYFWLNHLLVWTTHLFLLFFTLRSQPPPLDELYASLFSTGLLTVTEKCRHNQDSSLPPTLTPFLNVAEGEAHMSRAVFLCSDMSLPAHLTYLQLSTSPQRCLNSGKHRWKFPSHGGQKISKIKHKHRKAVI